MSLQTKRKLLWGTVLLAIAASWLPYFDIANSLVWVGPLPQPLALVLASNVILTACAIALYPLYFKPLSRKLDKNKGEL